MSRLETETVPTLVIRSVLVPLSVASAKVGVEIEVSPVKLRTAVKPALPAVSV